MSCLPKHGRFECNRCFVKSTPITIILIYLSDYCGVVVGMVMVS